MTTKVTNEKLIQAYMWYIERDVSSEVKAKQLGCHPRTLYKWHVWLRDRAKFMQLKATAHRRLAATSKQRALPFEEGISTTPQAANETQKKSSHVNVELTRKALGVARWKLGITPHPTAASCAARKVSATTLNRTINILKKGSPALIKHLEKGEISIYGAIQEIKNRPVKPTIATISDAEAALDMLLLEVINTVRKYQQLEETKEMDYQAWYKLGLKNKWLKQWLEGVLRADLTMGKYSMVGEI